ncbi:MAG: hypothetical protein L6R41_005560 [Letrouitia leprolyta]|nr:MAG: hypothetical protein L6R41_005560 [Letrouitia leprolyta]
MCLPRRSKKSYKPSSSDYYSPHPIAIKSDAGIKNSFVVSANDNVNDDLSDAFQSLSIKSEPVVAKTPVPSVVQIVKPPTPKAQVQKVPKGEFPSFPVPRHPRCRRCGWIPKYRDTVKASNPNGNVGRPYFICFMCKKNASDPNRPTTTRAAREVGWIAWDDYIGIHESNRPCFCGVVCRQDRAGVDSGCPGMGFWTCAYGACDFLSFRRDAKPIQEGAEDDGGFRPWLL